MAIKRPDPTPDYSIIDGLLARLAVQDMNLTERDIQDLKALADAGGDAVGLRYYIERNLPGWPGRSATLSFLLDVVARGILVNNGD